MKIESVIEKLINRWLDAGFYVRRLRFEIVPTRFFSAVGQELRRGPLEERPRKEGKREIEFLDWNT